MPIINYLKRRITKQTNVPVSQIKNNDFYDKIINFEQKSIRNQVEFAEVEILNSKNMNYEESLENYGDKRMIDENQVSTNANFDDAIMHNYALTDKNYSDAKTRNLFNLEENSSQINRQIASLASVTTNFSRKNGKTTMFEPNTLLNSSYIHGDIEKNINPADLGTERVMTSAGIIKKNISKNVEENLISQYKNTTNGSLDNEKLNFEAIYRYILEEIKKEMRN